MLALPVIDSTYPSGVCVSRLDLWVSALWVFFIITQMGGKQVDNFQERYSGNCNGNKNKCETQLK